MKKKIFILGLLLLFSMPIKAEEINNIETEAPLIEETLDSIEKKKVNIQTFSEETPYEIIDIYTLEDWLTFSKDSKNINNVKVILRNDIDFSTLNTNPDTIINEDVTIDGNSYSFKNIKYNRHLITYNLGTIKNLKIVNSNITTSASFANIIKENYGVIENTVLSNVTFKSGNYYSGFIGKNYGVVKGFNATNITMIANRYIGAVAALNSSFLPDTTLKNPLVKNTEITNASVSKVTIRSLLNFNKKTYRNRNLSSKDIMGDFFGGIVGKNHNASVINPTVNNIVIYADDYIGGVIGMNAYNNTNGNRQKALVQNANVSNLTIYAGISVGGIIGYSVSYEPISLSKISPTKSNHNSIMALLNKGSVKNNFYISGYSELGGAIGLNYSAKITNVIVNAKRKNYNIYSYYDEAAGLVADNEFGYVDNSRTNLIVKAKIFQAGGFCADNEGTIKNSVATGHVHTTKEAGGFIGSNLGNIVNSKSYGNIYVTKRIRVVSKVKVKQKNKKKKTKYKKVVKYYPYYSGNFSAYNGKVKYKGLKLVGKVSKSKYHGKRYLCKKRITNKAFGAYAR